MRIATLKTPLGDDALDLIEMTGQEELGKPFTYELTMFSPRGKIAVDDLLGQPVTVTLHDGDSVARYFNGVVTHAVDHHDIGRRVTYRARVKPLFSTLDTASGSRIFQQVKVPDLILELLRERGVIVEDGLPRNRVDYREWEYLTQYRESELNFIQRIARQEGLYYYFLHEEDRHVLVLSDGLLAHDKVPGAEKVPYCPANEASDAVFSWSSDNLWQSGSFVLKDYNYRAPHSTMLVRRDAVQEPANTGFERYDFPGEYQTFEEGERQVRLELGRMQAQQKVFSGTTRARAFYAGGLFSLTGHPEADYNQQYLLTMVHFRLSFTGSAGQRADTGPDTFQCGFQAIPAKVAYRPATDTPKPQVGGTQTATVVGKAGEEIWTDEFGRVKLKFHWDLAPGADEKSSCFVRVSQAAASNDWGSIYIPRVGDEVVVDHLEGDPDRPIVLGSVYNDANRPPYKLPENQTQSGIKTRSTKGGFADNCNEIRFEDKKGSEHLFVQAEKDLQINVKNDETRTVGSNQEATIGQNQTLNVKGSQAITIDGGQDNAGVTGTSLQVTGESRAHSTKDILVESETQITFKVGDTTIVMLPDKITLQAQGGAMIELTSDLLARAAGEAWMNLDSAATVTSSDGSQVLLNSDAEVSTSGTANLKGKTSKVTGASGTVTADANGVATKGSKVSLN